MDWYLYMVPLYSIQASFTNTQVIILYALLSLLTLTFSILFDTQVCWDFATSLSINSHLAVLLSHSDNLMNLQHWSSHSCNVSLSKSILFYCETIYSIDVKRKTREGLYCNVYFKYVVVTCLTIF